MRRPESVTRHCSSLHQTLKRCEAGLWQAANTRSLVASESPALCSSLNGTHAWSGHEDHLLWESHQQTSPRRDKHTSSMSSTTTRTRPTSPLGLGSPSPGPIVGSHSNRGPTCDRIQMDSQRSSDALIQPPSFHLTASIACPPPLTCSGESAARGPWMCVCMCVHV